MRMTSRSHSLCNVVFPLLLLTAFSVDSRAQPLNDAPMRQPGEGPRMRGTMMMGERKIVKQFDVNNDGRLDSSERKAAREQMKRENAGRGDRGPGGFGPRGVGPGGNAETPTPGAKIAKSDVKPEQRDLYDPAVFRTIFLEFDSQDWEDELADFIRTDVEVPATMTVDGKEYRGVGVGFRGASSLMMVGKGSKRSLNISIDFTEKEQRLLGYRTLNLLNASGDPSFMRGALYSHIAESLRLPAPKVNFVRVVINGESWGVYANTQQFNKDMLAEHFPESKGAGARWKVPGSPNGRGGLEYLGEDIAPYRSRYEIKTKDNESSWKALIDLCRTLNETPIEQLEAALKPKLDLDGVLWFLALDVALVNSDGYWTRASDYNIYLDPSGVFHIIPHDVNETFSSGGGPGGPRGGPGGSGVRERGEPRPDQGPGPGRPVDDRHPGPARPDDPLRPGGQGGMGFRPIGGGATLDPLIGLDDKTKPLRSRLLAVPSMRTKYLANIRTIASEHLDWNNIGRVVKHYREQITVEVRADTKKLSSFAAFERATSDLPASPQPVASDDPGPRRGQRAASLKEFIEQRRAYLLGHEAIKALPR